MEKNNVIEKEKKCIYPICYRTNNNFFETLWHEKLEDLKLDENHPILKHITEEYHSGFSQDEWYDGDTYHFAIVDPNDAYSAIYAFSCEIGVKISLDCKTTAIEDWD